MVMAMDEWLDLLNGLPPAKPNNEPGTGVDETALAWAPLSQHALIRVSGVDAEKFLQGQCTCDVLELKTHNTFLSGAHCNHKGRMLSSFDMALVDENTYLLRVHKSVAELAYQDLKKYIIFSKADISLEKNYLSLGLFGQNLASLVNDIPNLNTVEDTSEENKTYAVENDKITLRHSPNQWEIWLKIDTAKTLINRLKEYTQYTPQYWDYLNIKRGIGEVRSHTREELLPQEINLQLVGGVSFNKGCYTGQEVVARMHYKATLKKHMYRARLQTEEVPLPGTRLIENGSEKVLGSVILAAQSDSGQIELLALCTDSAIGQKKVSLSTDSSVNLQWLALPYAIPK